MATEKIRAVWWNVQDFGGSSYGRITNRNERISTIARVLKSITPDVFVLQEVTGEGFTGLPFSEIYQLLGEMQKFGNYGLLYPRFAGMRGFPGHSMVVFYNKASLEPTFSVPDSMKNLTAINKDALVYYTENSDKYNNLYGSELIKGNKKDKWGKSIDTFWTRYPILSQFKLLKVTDQPFLNVYSIHAKNPLRENRQINDRLNSDRLNEITDLAQIAKKNSTASTVTLIGGDFNGPAPSILNWTDCLSCSAADKVKNTNSTHNIRHANWDFSGTFPAYNYLNQALDKILLYQSSIVITSYPWVVNFLTGSLPNPTGSLASLESKNGYIQFPPWKDQDTINELMKQQKAYGIESFLETHIYSWQNLDLPWSTALVNQFNGLDTMKNMFYVSDHLPVAIDLILPASN